MHPLLLHYSYLTPEICQSYSNSVFWGDLTPSGTSTLQRFLKPCLQALMMLPLALDDTKNDSPGTSLH